MARAKLFVFEGLDQSGKQTQAELLRDFLVSQGRGVELISFPDYSTAIGKEIERGLHGGRDYPADVMQLLYVANRYERRPQIEQWLDGGTTVVCDRYLASSIAYGEAQGLEAEWLREIQRFLPQPDLTILLDIAPETAARRKAAGRDRYERDLALLSRVRASYRRQSSGAGWLPLDGERPPDAVSADIVSAVAPELARR